MSLETPGDNSDEHNALPFFVEARERRVVDEIVTDTILQAFELADRLEVSERSPSFTGYEIYLAPHIIERLTKLPLPDMIAPYFEPTTNTDIRLEVNSHFQASRPSLAIYFSNSSVSGGINSVYDACIQRSGGEIADNVPFQGEITIANYGGNSDAASAAADTETFEVVDTDVSQFIESLVEAQYGTLVTDEGVHQLSRLNEFIGDPQYPPLSRYIVDTLIEQGSTHLKRAMYEIDDSGTRYTLSVVEDDGELVDLTLLETTIDDIHFEDGLPIKTERRLGVRISRQNFERAIHFFKLNQDQVTEVLRPDMGDLHYLRETLGRLADVI